MNQELQQLQVMDVEQRLKEIKGSLGVIEWHIKVQLVYEYHVLRFTQRAAQLKIWSANDTAQELGLSKAGVCDDIRLAKELQTNPDLANLTKTSAMETLRNKT